MKIALSQEGVHEEGQNNWGPKVQEYLASAGIKYPAAWCMAFVHWCFGRAGLNLNHINPASVGFFADWGAKMGYLVYDPEPGDNICFNFDADDWPDHVGFVVRKVGPVVQTIEGNTGSVKFGGRDAVEKKLRSTSRCLFIRVKGSPPLDEKTEKRKIELRTWILKRRAEGWSWRKIKDTHNWAEYKKLGGR